MVRFLENFGLKFRKILHRPQPNPHLLVKIGKKKTPKGEAPAPKRETPPYGGRNFVSFNIKKKENIERKDRVYVDVPFATYAILMMVSTCRAKHHLGTPPSCDPF